MLRVRPIEVGKLEGSLSSDASKHNLCGWSEADAIQKMMNGDGTGKGLNIKGKSAKTGRLSGTGLRTGTEMFQTSTTPAACQVLFRSYRSATMRTRRLFAHRQKLRGLASGTTKNQIDKFRFIKIYTAPYCSVFHLREHDPFC